VVQAPTHGFCHVRERREVLTARNAARALIGVGIAALLAAQAAFRSPGLWDFGQGGLDSIRVGLSDTVFTARLTSDTLMYLAPQIDDGVADTLGRLFILDSRRGAVWRFDERGRSLPAIGTFGHGPGELYYPAAVTLSAERLYVLDVGNERVLGFGTSTKPPTVASVLPLPRPKAGLCISESVFITFGTGRDSLLRVLPMRGGPYRDLGAPLAPTPEVASALATGSLLCLDGLHTVVVLPHAVPDMRAYDTRSGRLSWTVQLRNYRREQIEQVGKVVRMTAPPAGFTVALGIHNVSPGVIAVQLRDLPGGGVGDHSNTSRPMTQYYGSSDGRYLGSQIGLPRIVAVSPGVLFVVSDKDSLTLVACHYRMRGGAPQ
jgi:hypothetical protein